VSKIESDFTMRTLAGPIKSPRVLEGVMDLATIQKDLFFETA
jgi:hypothetical protein